MSKVARVSHSLHTQPVSGHVTQSLLGDGALTQASTSVSAVQTRAAITEGLDSKVTSITNLSSPPFLTECAIVSSPFHGRPALGCTAALLSPLYCRRTAAARAIRDYRQFLLNAPQLRTLPLCHYYWTGRWRRVIPSNFAGPLPIYGVRVDSNEIAPKSRRSRCRDYRTFGEGCGHSGFLRAKEQRAIFALLPSVKKIWGGGRYWIDAFATRA